MRKLAFGLFILALIIPLMSSLAQDSPDDSTPEPGSPQDNECFEGGDWYGQCDTLLHWTCGWYLARYSDGVPGFEYENLPAWCYVPAALLSEPQHDTAGDEGQEACVCVTPGATYGWDSGGGVMKCAQITMFADPDGNGCGFGVSAKAVVCPPEGPDFMSPYTPCP